MPSKGLVAIVGNSGSGKTTLLNMMALLDKPDNGNIYFNNSLVSKWKEKRKCQYRNIDSSLLFQSYNLIEDESVIFNVTLPLLIKGVNKKEANADANIILEKVGISKELYTSKCKDLSGGEKQRVALARAIVTIPKVIFADEPTGALDYENSINVMSILSRLSKKRLTILVSHDEELVYRYADRIIKLEDGKIIDDENRHNINDDMPYIESKQKNTSFFTKYGFSHLLLHLKRSIISFISLCFSICMSLIVIGFSNGSTKSFDELTNQLFDIGTCSLSYEETNTIGSSSISLTKQRRATKNEITKFNNEFDNFEVYIDYRYLIPQYPTIDINENKITSISFMPICSFNYPYIDPNIVTIGKVPSDSLNEVIINNIAYDSLYKILQKDPLNCSFNVSNEISSEYYDVENDVSIIDYFTFKKRMKIVGVCEETTLLNSPKIFYSNIAMTNYLNSMLLNNLSSYLNQDVSWLERIEFSDNNSQLSNYSNLIFYKDITNVDALIADVNNSKDLKISSVSLDLKTAVLDLSNAAVYGLEIFFAISVIGLIIVLTISSLANYLKDRRKNAIFISLGASNAHIREIYLVQNLIIVFISLLLAIGLSILISLGINTLVASTIGAKKLIDIPLASFNGRRFLLPLLISLCLIIVSILTTSLPIIFSKSISINEELKNND